MKNITTVLRRLTACVLAVAMVALLIPEAAHADWDDRSGELPGFTWKNVIITGVVAGGALALFGFLKHRRGYPLEVSDKLVFDGRSNSTMLYLVNRGTEIVTISDLRFEKDDFQTHTKLPARIHPNETFQIVVQREIPIGGKPNKKTKLYLSALREGGQSVERSVSIRATD